MYEYSLKAREDKGILKFSAMEVENTVDAVLMHEWEGVKEPSFLPLWIACCDECRTRNEVETCMTIDVLSSTSDVGVSVDSTRSRRVAVRNSSQLGGRLWAWAVRCSHYLVKRCARIFLEGVGADRRSNRR